MEAELPYGVHLLDPFGEPILVTTLDSGSNFHLTIPRNEWLETKAEVQELDLLEMCLPLWQVVSPLLVADAAVENTDSCHLWVDLVLLLATKARDTFLIL